MSHPGDEVGMMQGAWVRFLGGPLDGQRRWFELLVEPDGRPHERLARRNARAECREVYVFSAGPLDDGTWQFSFAGFEPLPVDDG